MWTEETFRKKAHLFKIIMNYKWKFAERDASIIRKILSELGIYRGNILDVMCGDGRIAINLAKYGYNVTGIDFSSDFIRDAINKSEELGLSNETNFICFDVRKLESLKLSTRFNAALLVWSSLGYYSREEDIALLRKINKIVKPGGILVIFDILLRDNYEPFQLFSLLSYEKYQIYSLEKINSARNKLVRIWYIYRMQNDENPVYLGELRVELILYSQSELISIVKKAGWKQIMIRQVNGINCLIAQK